MSWQDIQDRKRLMRLEYLAKKKKSEKHQAKQKREIGIKRCGVCDAFVAHHEYDFTTGQEYYYCPSCRSKIGMEVV